MLFVKFKRNAFLSYGLQKANCVLNLNSLTERFLPKGMILNMFSIQLGCLCFYIHYACMYIMTIKHRFDDSFFMVYKVKNRG